MQGRDRVEYHRAEGVPLREFIRDGNIIHIDIDRDELNKNKTVTLPICADLGTALGQLVDAVTKLTAA